MGIGRQAGVVCGRPGGRVEPLVRASDRHAAAEIDPLDVVALTRLMRLTRGSADIRIGLVDGPLVVDHPGLEQGRIRELAGGRGAACMQPASVACVHGTFVAGMLIAKRGGAAPAICPGCTLLVRPIFAETATATPQVPNADAAELARAIVDCVEAGARIVNLSVGLAPSAQRGEHALLQALDRAARHGVVVVAAAGNQGAVGSSAITSHRWTIPVAACDTAGRPLRYSNLGGSIGRRGLSAPGDNITSLGPGDRTLTFGGTSAAAPFVTGAIALVWSLFPAAPATRVKAAVAAAHDGRRRSVTPPILDAWRTYVTLADAPERRLALDASRAA
jgi:hypothetical protein